MRSNCLKRPLGHNAQSNKETGPYQDPEVYSRKIGPSIRICHLNIEGISRAKCECLAKILKDQQIDVIALQETHTANEMQLRTRGKIPGFKLVAHNNHEMYGLATYVRNNITNYAVVDCSSSDDIFTVTIKINNLTIMNVYKPPNTKWPTPPLPPLQHPTVIIGDFNSHHTCWGYQQSDLNGEAIVDWMDMENLKLIYDAKEKGTFFSARWGKEYTPDLSFITQFQNSPNQILRSVLNNFPHSQHRPVILRIGMYIPVIRSYPKPRWNFKKANWKKFTEQTDANIRWIKPTFNNYDRFVGVIKGAARRCIPRGCRKEYIPGWTAESESLLKEFEENGNNETATKLIQSLNDNRKQIWTDTVSSLDFTHSSRKAWSLIRKLDSSKPAGGQKLSVNINDLAKHMISISKINRDKQVVREIRSALKHKKQLAKQQPSQFSCPFSREETLEGIKNIKSGKAAGIDGIYPEFLQHLGPATISWLTKFFSNILETGNLPSLFKKTKVISILKPNKDPLRVESYRPIALLSATLKLLERLIYNRISETINNLLPTEQAGFRPGRNCDDQIFALTSHIENGFENRKISMAVFLDLSAAYDTVWREGLLLKFISAIPCVKLTNLIGNMISNRNFQIFSDDAVSKIYKLNDGLPQGSVLAPLLFNLYTADLPATKSRKFIYADDILLVSQTPSFPEAEQILTADLKKLDTYFQKWCLRPNLQKTVVSVFHLRNKFANYKPSITIRNQSLQHCPFPKYLGVTLDRSLTYKHHINNTAAKIKSRNNILQKLAGTSWGANNQVLRSTALALCYSVAEYCASTWLNSAHTAKIDAQLNQAMRIITGCIRSTNVAWLPTLSNIPPPCLRRSEALLKLWKKISQDSNLPVHQDINQFAPPRLKSRSPSWRAALTLEESGFSITNAWSHQWQQSSVPNQHLVTLPHVQPPGFHLPRRQWRTLNRIRVNQGRCGYTLHKWGWQKSPGCDCGATSQTIHHVIAECPQRAFQGPLEDIHNATEEALKWINGLDLEL